MDGSELGRVTVPTLAAERFARAFPFAFAVDEQLRLTHVGSSLTKLAPGARPGVLLHEVLRVQRPIDRSSFDRLAKAERKLCLFEVLECGVTLRGEIVVLESGREVLFIGSPWLTSNAELVRLGLTFEDFATHDPMLDVLHLLQLQTQNHEDLRMLAERLDHEHAQAKDANAKLQAQNAELVEARRVAERASDARGWFLAAMSHEIRTPLHAILSITELLLDAATEQHQRDLLERLQQSGKGLLAQLNDVLDFSRLERDRIELEPIDCDARELLEEVVELATVSAEHKAIALSMKIGDAVPARIIVDRVRLQQVLTNLVSNAVKFTERGEVSVSLAADAAGGEGAAHVRLTFEIRDTGVGIDADQLSSIFDPFVQADAGITRRFGGTGLGLAIARRLTTAMGGALTVESEPGVGSTFRVELPVGLTSSRSSHPPVPLAGLCVAVVASSGRSAADDLCRALRGFGAEVSVVPTLDSLGGDALRACSLIVQDHGARALSGDLPAELLIGASQPDELRVPLIHVTSGPLVRSGRAELLRLGRPFSRRMLLQLVRRALGSSMSSAPGKLARTKARLTTLWRGAPRVLAVEDDALNRAIISRLLGRLGMTADVVDNGEEALEATGRAHYDAVLMDVQMPVMDGLEATRRIRARGGRQPFIIALTASACLGDRERCLAAGADEYLAKPLDVEALGDALARCAQSAGDRLSRDVEVPS